MGPHKSKGRRLPLLPLRGLLVYPSMVLHLDVGREKSVRALERCMMDDQYDPAVFPIGSQHRRTDAGRYLPGRHNRQSAPDAETAERHDPRAGGRRRPRAKSKNICRTTNFMK